MDDFEGNFHAATTSCRNSGDTSPSWGVINLPIISHTTAPLISVAAARQKNCGKLKQSTLKEGEGRGNGKGLNSRFGAGVLEARKGVFLMKVSQQFCNLL